MPRPTRIAAVLCASAMLLSACSNASPEVADSASDGASTIAAPSPSPSPAPVVTPDPSPTPEPVEPCPDGTFRVVPGMGDCITPAPAPEPEPEPEPEPAPAATKAPAPAATKAPAPKPANPCDDRGAMSFSITGTNFAYDKSSIGNVCSGDTVTLTNAEGGHSFTASSKASSSGASGDTGVFSGGSRSTTVSAPAGTYTYVCTLHPQDMRVELTFLG